jgi:hypothetical protein
VTSEREVGGEKGNRRKSGKSRGRERKGRKGKRTLTMVGRKPETEPNVRFICVRGKRLRRKSRARVGGEAGKRKHQRPLTEERGSRGDREGENEGAEAYAL